MMYTTLTPFDSVIDQMFNAFLGLSAIALLSVYPFMIWLM